VSLRVAPGDDAARARTALVTHLTTSAPWGVRVTAVPGGTVAPYAARAGGRAYRAAPGARAAAWGRPAVDIVSSGGYVDTLLGTILPLVPLFTPYLGLLLLFFNRVIPGLLTLLAAAFMSPVAIARPAAVRLPGDDWSLIIHRNVLVLVVLALLAAAFAVLLGLEFTGLGFGVVTRTAGTVACIVLIPVVMRLYPFPPTNEFYADLIKQPWLPAETITLTSGQAFTGYLLSDNGTWLVVLTDSTRTIRYYRSAQVASQQICQLTGPPAKQPLIPLFPAHLSAPTTTPACTGPVAGRAAR
jgi:hypothetical protein